MLNNNVMGITGTIILIISFYFLFKTAAAHALTHIAEKRFREMGMTDSEIEVFSEAYEIKLRRNGSVWKGFKYFFNPFRWGFSSFYEKEPIDNIMAVYKESGVKEKKKKRRDRERRFAKIKAENKANEIIKALAEKRL